MCACTRLEIMGYKELFVASIVVKLFNFQCHPSGFSILMFSIWFYNELDFPLVVLCCTPRRGMCRSGFQWRIKGLGGGCGCGRQTAMPLEGPYRSFGGLIFLRLRGRWRPFLATALGRKQPPFATDWFKSLPHSFFYIIIAQL